jgi:pimeloyl-ACP methyl ester carboxylesterase
MVNWSKPHPDSLFASVERVKIHYKLKGSGLGILLLHGSGSSLQGVEKVAHSLARSYTVVTPDLPGSALSGPREDRDYRITTFAKTMAGFMAQIGFSEYAVAGNSLGGNIAWNMALDYPAAVKALCLINATGYPDKELPAGLRLMRNPFLKPLLRSWLPRGVTEKNLRSAVGPGSDIVSRDMVDRVYGLMSLPGNRSAFVDLANTDQIDRSEAIRKISVPTLILRSAHVDGQYFERDIAGSSELIRADGGHLLPEEQPEWVSDAILRFMESLK